jgi:hypothetical protein
VAWDKDGRIRKDSIQESGVRKRNCTQESGFRIQNKNEKL